MAAGYVASARIDHGRPRPVAPRQLLAGAADAWPGSSFLVTPDDCLVDAAPTRPRAGNPRWEAFRERWSQLWFFVLDPESWR
jgi:hypothetical protein